MFSRSDFEALAELLKGLSGRFIMTVNDHPETRRIFGGTGFRLQSRQLHYGVCGGAQKARELIVLDGKNGKA